ncbi:hypothetical protein PUNSTDRAFT_135452 [Punctularia strigosozonata HHB-11173 SS5]|uniref:uncharacterized protein n=1 Tax=Punctularia strigosozonata (strain HHB-11173) TaxID=741275 RepID=UPI000441789B|nr:uncharacterized protein PUNSTDRAFT_135452 [Punctularia strigosozonata HHB-11173 SS5]EIN07933.1 hypothetical protein PUNSTDRAFT_135452 [Punctularia strigosozonata HHB-11173 SS5]
MSILAGLPDDIILEIIDHVHSRTLCDSILLNNWPVVASRVCRRWRALLLGHTRYWSDVRIRLWIPIDLNKAQVYLARSGECPLDVRLYSGTTGAVDVRQVHHAMYLLIPQLFRWRRFVAVVDGAELAERIITVLRERRAEWLETFEIHNSGIDDGPSLCSDRLVLALSGGVPALKCHRLGSLGLTWTSASGPIPLLQGLTTLELYSDGCDEMPTQTFKDLLAASPRLEHLVLHGYMIVRAPGEPERVEACHLSEMRRLVIGWLPDHDEIDSYRRPWLLIKWTKLQELKVVGDILDFLGNLSEEIVDYSPITTLILQETVAWHHLPRYPSLLTVLATFRGLRHMCAVTSSKRSRRFLRHFLAPEVDPSRNRRMAVQSLTIPVSEAHLLRKLFGFLAIEHLRLLADPRYDFSADAATLDYLAAHVCRVERKMVGDSEGSGVPDEEGVQYLPS